MKREDLEAWLVRHGYERDRFGHYHKTFLDIITKATGGRGDRHYRYKLSSTSARHEIQVSYNDGTKYWVRLHLGYYKHLELTPDDKLKGMKR